VTKVSVSVGREHLQKLIKPARPFTALAELVSNALDSDATNVDIALERTTLGGVGRVTVSDDGEGISHARLDVVFGKLGGSWKARGLRQTTSGRQLFGREGQGRFRAFALGDEVTWTSVCDDPTGRVKFSILGRAQAPEAFEVTTPESVDAPTGTTVQCTSGDRAMTSLLAEDVPERLAARYGSYLFKNRGVTITFDGRAVDIYRDGAVADRESFTLEVEGEAHRFLVEIAEWSGRTPRSMVLFGEDPTEPLVELPVGIHAPGFNFSVAVTSPAFDEADASLADLGHPRFHPIIESVRAQLREYFAERQVKRTRELVETWKQQQAYPYTGEAADEVEEASRELFNVVAVTASTGIPEDSAALKLSLRLIREALETAPSNLRRVLSEVLDLPEQDIDDLAAILDQTPLSSLVAMSRTISDRLNFLRSLEVLLFDPDIKKSVLERSQLHRMLAAEPWIFGEHFSLGVDDKGIIEVLRRHLEHLGRSTLNLAHVALEDRQTAVVDLMLTKTLEDSQRQRHLVVELKRPDCTIGYKERQQIEAYAMAVANDERFRDADCGWDFVLVANRVSRDISKLSMKRNQPPGLIHDDPDMDLRIWIRHWGGIIEDRRRGLHFAKEQIAIDPSREAALDDLRLRYPEFLPDEVLRDRR
jgi:histidine kinase/DNA gyrase B/HSP90-like ATPase